MEIRTALDVLTIIERELLAQNLFSLGATNSRKSKRRNDKAVNSPYFKGPLQPKFPSHFIIYYEEFEGANHESAAYFSVSCIVSNL